MRYYVRAFQKYGNYTGRASRKEFWLFFLIHLLVIFLLSFLDIIIQWYPVPLLLDCGYLTIAYLLFSLCPLICVQIRRLHDVGEEGFWWILFGVPLLWLYVLYLYCKPGDPEDNDYGPPPGHRAYGRPAASDGAVHGPSQARYCGKCGFQLIPGSHFCSRCGAPVPKR